MSTAWTLLADEVCSDALRHLNVLGEGEAASGDEMQDALRGLDTVLKELSLYGYTWPKLSGEAALVWTGVQTVELPEDYYGYPVVWQLTSGQRYPLSQATHAEWVRMADRAATGTASHFYVSPAGVLHLWPVPETDPGLTVQYQRIVDDAALELAPDVLQTMRGALAWGVADEIGMKFAVPQPVRLEVSQRWAAKRALMLASAIPYEPIEFGVR